MERQIITTEELHKKLNAELGKHAECENQRLTSPTARLKLSSNGCNWDVDYLRGGTLECQNKANVIIKKMQLMYNIK